MGIDAEDVLVCLWKFIRFFVDTTYVCAEKYPFVSSILFLVFLGYVFFDLLLHHFPLFVFLAVLLRIFWSSEPQEPPIQHVDRHEKREREASSYRRQNSRRTLFSKHHRSLVAASPENDAKLDVVHEQLLGSRASKSDEDDEEEEEISDNNHAVEWNEDDQRNLDDLGVSEIERNRRLESLIAKRRARKLVKPRGGSGGISPAVVGPISVAKEARLSRAGEGSRTPGSAPSVLTMNPFDIPYDPTEEKPDLTADSFQEEFTRANQKDDVTYCRHESFSWAGFGFEPEKGLSTPSHPSSIYSFPCNDAVIEQFLGPTKSQIAHMPSITESDQSQCQTQSLNTETSLDSTVTTTNDTVVSEQDPPNDSEITNSSEAIEIETEPSVTEDSETNSSYSLEASNRSIEGVATAETHCNTSPTANDRNDDERAFGNLASHTPSYSIASDMQVEVSEIGSAPLTIGNVSPIDGDSLSFDEELERDHLDYEIESLDGDEANRASVGKKKQNSAMRFADELSSHPFFESAYKASKETRDSRSEDQAKQDDNEVAMDNMSIPSEEADSGLNFHIEQAITLEDTDLNVANSEEENAREVSSSVEEASRVDSNSPGSKFDQLVIRQESFLVNKSSPSSPTCTPIGRVPVDYAFSSNPDRWIALDATMDKNLIDEEEQSASGKICEETEIGFNIIESMSEDKKGKE